MLGFFPIGQHCNRVSLGDRILSDKLGPEAHTVSRHFSTTVVKKPHGRLSTVMMVKSG